MSEKEKMINGEKYNAMDNLLIQDRFFAKSLCMEYNSLYPDQLEKKNEILTRLLGKRGNNLTIEPNFFCDYGYNIELGENFYINHNSVFLDCAKIIIGDNVFIGPNCGFYTAGHPIIAVERNAGMEFAKPINIGNNVWIGGNVTILPGVTIGDNSVIGAGSVVTKDIPSDVVAVGNPCKPIKQIDNK